MKNWKELKNSFNLLFFYYQDALKGLLQTPFLRKKRNRYILFTILGVLLFLLYGLSLLASLLFKNPQQSLSHKSTLELTHTASITFISTLVVLSVILYIFINSIIRLTKSSLYVTNILPYSRQEILIAQKLFKLSISAIVYEGIFLISYTSFLRFTTSTPWNQLLLFFLSHLLFCTTYLTMDAIYAVVAKGLLKLSKSQFSISTIVLFLDVISFLLCACYFIFWKFEIDSFVVQIPIHLTIKILTIIGIAILFLLFVIWTSYKFLLSIQYSKKKSSDFIYLPMIKANLMTSLPAIYRNKTFIRQIAFVVLLLSLIISQSGLKNGLASLGYLNSLIVFSAIVYANATVSVRKFYNLFRISVFREMTSLILGAILFCALPLILLFYFKGTLTPFFVSLAVYFCSLIVGFLFPVSNGNLNELISIIVITLFSLLFYPLLSFNNLILSLLLLAVFIVILNKFLAQGRIVAKRKENPLLNSFKWGNVSFIILVFVDCLLGLSQINGSKTVVTLLGIKIVNKITSTNISMNLSLSDRFVITYLIAVSLLSLLAHTVIKILKKSSGKIDSSL
ncbi:MAG: hypothetical protein Q4A90_03470 [Streptococcus sp.]|nr:hypothetical protein [Streptococcus sp.]